MYKIITTKSNFECSWEFAEIAAQPLQVLDGKVFDIDLFVLIAAEVQHLAIEIDVFGGNGFVISVFEVGHRLNSAMMLSILAAVVA